MNVIENTVANLNKRGFHAELLPDAEVLKQRLCELLPKEAVLAKGGSMTLEALGILPYLEEKGYTLFNTSGVNSPDSAAATHFFTGTNALTEDGKLVNTDGRGNRVARMITGVPNVIVICGKNKIVKDTDAALARIKNIAAPQNAKRLGRLTPCVNTGRCMDCNSPDRICRATVIQTNPSLGVTMYVYILDMELGY